MEYIAALTPSAVMAVAFTALIVTIVKSQGGANKAKEDAAVDAALAQTDAAQATRADGSGGGARA
ncbi:hypothetical protein [Streptomyces sp. URMC 125]|uniref:hypothetical protein n=1 Tax=Streptomyces sp. URMC 125 TaxID=3423419 RepID=UPI003F1DAE1D